MEEKKKSNSIVFIFMIIVLIIVIGFLTYMLITQKNDYEEEIRDLKKELKTSNVEENQEDDEDSVKDSEKTKENDDTKEVENDKETSKDSNKSKNNNKEEKIYQLGETWEVDGQWRLTINSVKSTTDRNQFSDKNPAQVVIITYTYENLGYESSYMDGLYINIGNQTVVDANGEIADSYPGSITNYPKEVPVGAKCVDAQDCIGLNNVSDYITLTFSQYDGNGNKQTGKFNLKVD